MTAPKEKQSIFTFQGKDQKEQIKNFLLENFITRLSDVKAVLKELHDDPFVEYEPIMQVIYNNARIQNLVEQRKAMLNIR